MDLQGGGGGAHAIVRHQSTFDFRIRFHPYTVFAMMMEHCGLWPYSIRLFFLCPVSVCDSKGFFWTAGSYIFVYDFISFCLTVLWHTRRYKHQQQFRISKCTSIHFSSAIFHLTCGYIHCFDAPDIDGELYGNEWNEQFIDIRRRRRRRRRVLRTHTTSIRFSSEHCLMSAAFSLLSFWCRIWYFFFFLLLLQIARIRTRFSISVFFAYDFFFLFASFVVFFVFFNSFAPFIQWNRIAGDRFFFKYTCSVEIVWIVAG